MYNSNGNVSKIADNGGNLVEYTYNTQNRLSEISTESTTYTLLYDGFGNQSAIKAGDNTLSTYEYGAFNGKLSQITYGNGHVVKYVYNDLEFISEIWYNDDTEPAYEYQYTSDGKLTRLTDNINGTVTVYKYDTDGRLISGIEYDLTNSSVNASTRVQYNDESYVSNVEYVTPYHAGSNMSSITSSYVYLYDKEGKITDEYIYVGEQTGEAFYGYDGHDRLISTNYYFDPVDSDSSYFSYSTDIVYLHQSVFTYPLVWEYTIDVEFESSNNSYYCGTVYNSDGNIISIVDLVNYTTQYRWSYDYDDLHQLIREDNSQLGQTYIYEYDDAGNIVSKKTYSYTTNAEITSTPLSVDTYVYSTSAWGDLLTSYNGTAITYDEIGNPLSYYNGSSYTFTWDGRRLVSAVKGSNNMSFIYNDEGIRTTKTVNGVTTHYVYSGNLLISEYTDTEAIVYIYDVNGSPIGFRYRLNTYADDVWDTYWYVKNVQGDIVEIYSSAGVKLVTYKYDAWGKTTVAYSNNGASTTAVKNNLTYRGYYYDSYLGLYYLQSRYYDPAICRFINADGYVSTGQGLTGYNMFAYCGNNPVMRVDPDGEGWLLFIALMCVLVALTSCDIEEKENAAREKYNESTVNINGENPDGIIDVEIIGDDIKILDSFEISNRYEQKAILNVAINSESYTGENKNINKMIREWSAHNLGYKLTKGEKMNTLVSWALGKDDANLSAKDVNISSSDNLSILYFFATLGGIISW